MEGAYKRLELDSWKRRAYFEFYSTFDQPFFGLDTEVEYTNALEKCKANKTSFFIFYMYCAHKALNRIPEFRTRIVDGEPRLYNVIHVGTTIGRPDGSFGFAYAPFTNDFQEFSKGLKEEINRVNNSEGLRLNQDTGRIDLVHCSSVPWISFTGIKHASNSMFKDSIPKLTFGKFYNKDNKVMLPLSVHAHHGLMDAIHVSEFLKETEKLLMNKNVWDI